MRTALSAATALTLGTLLGVAGCTHCGQKNNSPPPGYVPPAGVPPAGMVGPRSNGDILMPAPLPPGGSTTAPGGSPFPPSGMSRFSPPAGVTFGPPTAAPYASAAQPPATSAAGVGPQLGSPQAPGRAAPAL